ncbi:MAG: hypothetical protein ABSH51_15210 [Solirubrobacteraceae bacterium]
MTTKSLIAIEDAPTPSVGARTCAVTIRAQIDSRGHDEGSPQSEPETGRGPLGDIDLEAPAQQLPSELDLDPDLARGLRVLSETDREALLLIAWEDLPGDHTALLARIVAEPGDPRLRQAPHERSSRLRGRKGRPWTRARPRFLAGSTLGLAGVGAALLLVLGGSAAPPAFAITKEGDGSVLVTLSHAEDQNLPQVNAKLAAMGTHEQITIYMASGPAAVPGSVTCTRAPGTSSPSGPQVKVLDGTNGTEVIRPAEAAGNTGEGTFHLDRCVVSAAGSVGNTGNSGAG